MNAKTQRYSFIFLALGVINLIASMSALADEFIKNGIARRSSRPLNPPATETNDSESYEVTTKGDKPYYASMGLGKTLPENVLRLRMPLQSANGSFGYDDAGKKVEQGFNINVNAAAFIFEYGLTDHLSLQVLVPYITRNYLTLDGAKFEHGDTYSEQASKFNLGVARVLEANGICANLVACLNLITSGYSLPTDTPVTLPTGETFTMKAGIPIQTYTDSLVKNAAKPANGTTGLGDLEFGVLYALMQSDTFTLALGGGFRLPTGKFEDVPTAKRPTGGGVTQFGFRINVDWMALPGLWLSWQNQTETPLTSAKKTKSSLIDPTQSNPGDPTTDAAKASGSDGKANQQTYKAKGLRQKGTLRFEYGLTDLGLMPFAIGAGYNYDFKQANELDGVEANKKASIQTMSMLIKWSGLTPDLMFPVSLELENERPLKARISH